MMVAGVLDQVLLPRAGATWMVISFEVALPPQSAVAQTIVVMLYARSPFVYDSLNVPGVSIASLNEAFFMISILRWATASDSARSLAPPLYLIADRKSV